MEKEKIRPLYSEFQGYLSQAPKPEKSYDSTDDEALWIQYNDSVDLLSKITGEDYKRFNIKPIDENSSPFIRLITYRQKLGGLISHLYGKYFPDEPAPFSGGPSTVITQSQQQSQFIQMVLDMQSMIDKQMPHFSEGSKEKGFLQKLKSQLSSIANVTQLLNQLFKLAKEFGLNIDSVSKIFS